MSDRVWMSSVHSNYSLGNKSGVRAKYHSGLWDPAKFKLDPLPKNVFEAMDLNSQGFSASLHDMPAAAAIWNATAFKRQLDALFLAGYIVITGELVDIFSQMDLGEGGLVPLPFF